MKRVLCCFLLLLSSFAQAAVWGYVDERGQVHLANSKLDARYELFFNAASEPEATNEKKPAVQPKLQGRLAQFFESQDFKSLRPILKDASAKHGIEFELLQALIAVESGYNKKAVSPKGALGLMQIMPDTAARFGVTGDKKRTIEDKLFDPKTNIALGARYLAVLMKMFPKRLDLTLAGYNAGENAVLRYKNAVPPFKETINYVQTVSELYAALKPPEPPKPVVYVPSNVRLQMPLFNARRNMPEGTAPRLRGSIQATPAPSQTQDAPEETESK